MARRKTKTPTIYYLLALFNIIMLLLNAFLFAYLHSEWFFTWERGVYHFLKIFAN